ncbi:MAG TPA: DEAD/DEAH box helicase [Stellaceae bacterium]|nr:DEAD/DEAH box helicase [Stellaceae bacterium]
MTDGAIAQDRATDTEPLPRGAVALHVVALWRRAGEPGLLYVSHSADTAEHLGANIHALFPDCPVMVFPRWDCLPYDPVGPSREIMGRRNSVLRRLADPIERPLVIATPEAVLQRVPPRSVWHNATLKLQRGGLLALDDLRSFLEQAGYVVDTLVTAPGEAALHGQVVDVFPAGALAPVRVDHQDGRITGISGYDPLTQRTTGELAEVVLDAACETAFEATEEALDTLFAYMPQAAVLVDPGVDERADLWRDQIREAYEGWKALPRIGAATGALPPPDRLYCDAAEWTAHLARRRAQILSPPDAAGLRIPTFATEANPTRAYPEFIAAQRAQGQRIVLAAAEDRDRKIMTRRAAPILTAAATRAEDWQTVVKAPPDGVLTLQADFEAGFRVPDADATVIAAADLLGSRAGHQVPMEVSPGADFAAAEPLLRIGDPVVHGDHGIGLLRGLETVASEGMAEQDTIRLEYAGGSVLMVPMQEIGAIWDYGAAPEAVSLDRLGGEAWSRRRREVADEIAETAQVLVTLAKERAAREAAKLIPPAREYERFVAGFPFVATADQSRAVEEILAELRSGHPMDRLICGDVGFGKTEAALRAAAAAVLGGVQVAVVVPTTVLARQHLGTFRRRFAGFGVRIGHLSRLARPAEARAVKRGLRDGSVDIVIGTQAIAGRDVRFRRLGLMIIDEEQRFGTRIKEKLHAFAKGVHVLTLTATPIPRTLQRALSGLQSLSVLATPPVRRWPIRTVIAAFDPGLLREALLFERRRGGQSFFVCPHIEDIAPLGAGLQDIVPELDVKIVHARLPAEEIDEAVVGFAEGRGDILLATNIIENGLDIPRANTILVWRPDRFGTAQLHQLRGRVGRGRRQGLAYFLTDPAVKLAPATQKRLSLLADLDRLGAGLTISRRDLELRGAGDILGEKQAGHVRLIGAGLYRHLLDRALAEARHGEIEAERTPELKLDVAGLIPADYVADPEVRINLYARLARLRGLARIEEFAEEIEDRFGEPPPAVTDLLDLARIGEMSRRLGVVRIDAGPKAIALTFDPARRDGKRPIAGGGAEAYHWSNGRLVYEQPTGNEERLPAVIALLARLGHCSSSRSAAHGGVPEPRG